MPISILTSKGPTTIPKRIRDVLGLKTGDRLEFIITNVLVRYLTRDDAEQYHRAKTFLEATCTAEKRGYVNTIVLSELVWVLKTAYGATKDELVEVLEQILLTRQLEVAHRDAVWAALQAFKQGTADFSDCLIDRLNRDAGCTETATFDQKAGKLGGVHIL